MIDLRRLIWFAFVGLFRSRASLEAEILALRHQLNILRRKSPKRPTLGVIDRPRRQSSCTTGCAIGSKWRDYFTRRASCEFQSKVMPE
jgi:hypothetical protein